MHSIDSHEHPFTRRRLMYLTAAAAGGALLPIRNVPAAGLDLEDPEDRLTALAKLRGSLDGGMVMWWMKGVYYGVVADVLTPLFGTLIGSFQRLKPEPGKGFELTMLELSYFTDLENRGRAGHLYESL